MSRAPAPAGRRPSRARALAAGTLLLLVEDEEITRLALRHQLESAGFAVDAAGDGREGLARFRRTRYGLVFTDLQMPRMDGLALARAIRACERDDARRRTPIVVLTATLDDSATCREAGIDDCVAKPPELPELLAKLRAWLPHAEVPAVPAAPAVAPGPMLRDFAAAVADALRALDAALARQDGADVVRQAHRINGISRTVGARALAEASDRLEAAGKGGPWETVRAEAATLRRAFDLFRSRLGLD